MQQSSSPKSKIEPEPQSFAEKARVLNVRLGVASCPNLASPVTGKTRDGPSPIGGL